MAKILMLQSLAVTQNPIEEESNSDTSLTCDGNSCISFNCGGAT